eukprot:Clim_evm1s61 gene=Clim_evmTU1s61
MDVSKILYGSSGLGQALEETIRDFMEEGRLTEVLAGKIQEQYLKSLFVILAQQKNRVDIKAKLATYRHADDVWRLTLEDADFEDRETGRMRRSRKARIVALPKNDILEKTGSKDEVAEQEAQYVQTSRRRKRTTPSKKKHDDAGNEEG